MTNDLVPLGKVELPARYAVALYILFFIWGARVLLKLLLSENHLANRAEEKRTLINTFIALVGEGYVEPADRFVALEPIFSLSEDGIVKDDSIPVNNSLLNRVTDTRSD